MTKMTAAEWTELAREARGFGDNGRLTLEEYIESRIRLAVSAAENRFNMALVGERLERKVERVCDRIDAIKAG